MLHSVATLNLPTEIAAQLTKTYPVSETTDARLANTFTYHAPRPDQLPRYQVLREKAKELAILICICTPPSREQSIALTDLEGAIFNANAAIARHETDAV